MLIGSSSYPQNATAVKDRGTRFGAALAIYRWFCSGVPSGWSFGGADANQVPIISFKIPPKDILAGMYDVPLAAWFKKAPRLAYWCFYHECEDNIEAGQFTAAEFRAAWEHVADIANRNIPLRSVTTPILILMEWTLNPASGRKVADYLPNVHGLTFGWDTYMPSNPTPKGIHPHIDRIVKFMKTQHQSPFIITETGSLAAASGAARARFLLDCAGIAKTAGAHAWLYYDGVQGGDYRLSLPVEYAAMHHLLTSGA